MKRWGLFGCIWESKALFLLLSTACICYDVVVEVDVAVHVDVGGNYEGGNYVGGNYVGGNYVGDNYVGGQDDDVDVLLRSFGREFDKVFGPISSQGLTFPHFRELLQSVKTINSTHT
jgi:hypothetical protein